MRGVKYVVIFHIDGIGSVLQGIDKRFIKTCLILSGAKDACSVLRIRELISPKEIFKNKSIPQKLIVVFLPLSIVYYKC